MRCQTFNTPLGVKSVIGPSRACANHHFSGGYDFPKGSTYSPPRHRKVRFPPFLPCGKTADTPLLLLSPQSRLCGGPFGGGISFGNRALCEADAAPAGALWTMPHPAGLVSLSMQSARNFQMGRTFYGWAIRPPILPPACENLSPVVLSQLWGCHVL